MEQNKFDKTVMDIAQNYSENKVFLSAADMRPPSRNNIIGLIKQLRNLFFPGYFADRNFSITNAQYFIGNLMHDIYTELVKQVDFAICYSKSSDTECEKCPKSGNMALAHSIADEFMAKLPALQQQIMNDVEAGFNGDPAAKSLQDVIISYPGVFAVFVYRLAHELCVEHVPYIPRIMTEYAHSLTGMDINPGAIIGRNFFVDHGTGLVIGETTEIGDNVKLYQGVTLGALSTRKGQLLRDKKRHPTIENDVTIYSGATILGGNTVIGAHSVIGGNTFLTSSVPPYSKVSIKAPDLTIRQEVPGADPMESWDWHI